MRSIVFMLTPFLTASIAAAAPPSYDTKTIAAAAAVIQELRGAPDNGIPERIWDAARCVVVMPGVKKAAFIVGGEVGKGVVSCRNAHRWSAPVFMTLEKGSFGAQFGAESVDVVLMVMNGRGMERLLQNKVTLGADGSLAAGPVGRTGTAATDAQITSEMLSYSRARGLFAGVDLSGGVLRPDYRDSQELYGHPVVIRDVLLGIARERTPAAADAFIAALDQGAKKSAPERH